MTALNLTQSQHALMRCLPIGCREPICEGGMRRSIRAKELLSKSDVFERKVSLTFVLPQYCFYTEISFISIAEPTQATARYCLLPSCGRECQKKGTSYCSMAHYREAVPAEHRRICESVDCVNDVLPGTGRFCNTCLRKKSKRSK